MSTNTIDPPVSQLTPSRKPGETQRVQTLCIEIPVTVQGSRNTHPSAPFLEETRTVIVFPQGAVLRLSEIVVQGQIVIVQNMRVKQEVACRVISSKPGATSKGYVELEFTQPAQGFWGISFPGEALAARPVVPDATPEQTTAPVAAEAPAITTSNSAMGIVTPASPMNAPQKLTPETTLELNRAIAASFANLRETAKKPEASENAKPAIEKKEPAARPAVETRPAPASEARPAPVAVAPPAPKAVAPPVTRSVAPPASAPMNSTSNTLPSSNASTQVNKTANVSAKTPTIPQAITQNAARSESRAQKTSKEPAPVALADAIVPTDAELITRSKQRTQTDSSRAVKTSEASSSGLAVDSRRASGVESEGLMVLSDLGAAPDFGNQLLSAKAAEQSRSGRNKMILVAAAAIVVAAGAGSYFWYAKAHRASASASGSVSGAGAGIVAPSSATPNATTSSPQPAAGSATVSQPPNSRQPNNSAQNTSGRTNSGQNNPAGNNTGAPASNNRAANNQNNGLQPIVVNARQPNALPMKITAPTAPSRSNATNAVSAPDLGNTAPTAGTNGNGAGMGSIISSSMPAPPPPTGGNSTGNYTNSSVLKEPKLISSVLPVYPKAAAVRGDAGEVTVDATVNELGKVVAVKAIAGPPTLREAAVTAVSQWRYQPATLNGKPALTHVTVKLMFAGKK
jgi:TonB family protein